MNKKAQAGWIVLKALLSLGLIVGLIAWLTGGAVIGLTGLFAKPAFWVLVVLGVLIYLGNKK